MCVVENIRQIIDGLRTDKETLVVVHYSDTAHSDNDIVQHKEILHFLHEAEISANQNINDKPNFQKKQSKVKMFHKN